MGGSVSSLSSTREESTKSVRGMEHFMRTERTSVVPGVAQIMIHHGVIVEMDAPFQVGSVKSNTTYLQFQIALHRIYSNLQQNQY